LSWLPERVAVAARRARPDEFARYLEELAYGIIGTLGPASNLELAAAARTGLAAGLGLLGIAAPERL
jgi:arginyl-tRNA synthetase